MRSLLLRRLSFSVTGGSANLQGLSTATRSTCPEHSTACRLLQNNDQRADWEASHVQPLDQQHVALHASSPRRLARQCTPISQLRAVRSRLTCSGGDESAAAAGCAAKQRSESSTARGSPLQHCHLVLSWDANIVIADTYDSGNAQ